MYSPTTKLKPPGEYDFPYKPYDIQAQLMHSLYSVLEEKQIGIFESPTGTGKSLTLTCAALRWLEDHQSLVREDLNKRITNKETEIQELEYKSQKAEDWISAQYTTNQQRTELNELRFINGLLKDYDEELQEMRKRHETRKTERKLQISQQKDLKTNIESDTQTKSPSKDILDENEDKDEESGDDTPVRFHDVQIFFCSRTHSQLAQVVREIKRTAYGKRVRCITLGSRQQLCVNPKVKRLGNTALINEHCLELSKSSAKLSKSNEEVKENSAKLSKSNEEVKENNKQKGKEKTNCGCPFKLPNTVQQLKETALFDILDIEDLVAVGNEQKACPYYAARSATAAAAQLVMLPYQLLLHRRNRMHSGINLRGAVVIIDEAHNLLDTIAQLHSCELTEQQLQQIETAISAYRKRYLKLLSAANLLSVNQLLFIVRQLLKLLGKKSSIVGDSKDAAISSRLLRTFELSAEGEFFNIDLFELLKFCERTRFAQKLHGFTNGSSSEDRVKENKPPMFEESATVQLLQRLQQEKDTRQFPKRKENLTDSVVEDKPTDEQIEATLKTSNTSSNVAIYNLLTFLEALTENAEDGRILVQINHLQSESLFRYIVLNPGRYFEDVVREARAIIIAGGTMRPTNELTEQLLHICPERVRLHFYDHVVSTKAVLPFIVKHGPVGRRLCFNYTQRDGKAMLNELAMILQNLSQVVPAGLVCFFPSYDYLDRCYEHLRNINILETINVKKTVFRELKSYHKGESVEQMLKDYETTIKQKGGAILLSVVNGKLSEGLNFKDDLCRGVVVVGMPYANSKSLVLQERMRYLDATLQLGAGNQYYENLCMKAVNQCIGRSVRHIYDYAAVFLLDERYASDHIKKKLPQWISRNLQVLNSFGQVQASTAKYFKR